MSFVLGLVLIGTTAIGQPFLRARAWGARLLAVTLLLAASFLTSVTNVSQPIVVASLAGIAVLTVTLSTQREAQLDRWQPTVSGLASAPAAEYRWSPMSLEPTTLAVGLTAWMLLRNILAVGPSATTIAPYGLGLALLVGVDQLRRAGELAQEELVRPFTAFLVAVLLLSPYLGDAPWMACRAEKCSVVGQIYRGIFPSENAMAIFLAFTIVLSFAIPRRTNRLVQVSALSVLLLATGARTALFGLVLAVVGARAFALVARQGADGTFRVPRILCLAAAAGLTGVAMVLLTTADELTLSGRGRTWRAALLQVPLSSLTGAGSSRWVEFQDRGLLTQHFPHSQYLHLQFSGGLIAIALWVLLLTSLLRRATGLDRAALGAAATPTLLVAVLGATEIIWNPATVDSFSVLIMSVLLLSPRPAGAAASASGWLPTTARPAGIR